MTQPIDPTGWLPNLIGTLDVEINGTLVSVPRRSLWNFIGSVAIVDNPDFDRTDITVAGGGGSVSVTGNGLVSANGSGGIAAASSTNVRYTGGKLQTDANVQWKSGSIFGDLAWTPTTANRVLTLPDATDTLMGRSTTDTATNKTLNLSNNTVTDTSAATGDIVVFNGTRFARMAKGANSTFLGVNGSGVLGFYTVASGGSSAGTSGQVQTSDGAGGFLAPAGVTASSGFLSSTGVVQAGGGSNYKASIQPLVGLTTGYSALYLLPPATTETSSNPSIYSNGTNVYVNAPSGAGSVILALGGASTPVQLSSAKLQFGAPIAGNAAPLRLLSTSITFAGADITLSTSQAECPRIKLVSGSGGTVNLIAPDVENSIFIVDTTGSGMSPFIHKVGGASGTGVLCPSSKITTVIHNGTDYKMMAQA